MNSCEANLKFVFILKMFLFILFIYVFYLFILFYIILICEPEQILQNVSHYSLSGSSMRRQAISLAN